MAGRRPHSVRHEVDEGMLLARYACRMAIKNRIVIHAISGLEPLGQIDLIGEVRVEVDRLADESRASADRIAAERRSAGRLRGRPAHQHDYRDRDYANLRRRERISRGVERRLRALSADERELEQIVMVGRADAWGEVAGSIERRMHHDPAHEPPDGLGAELDRLTRVQQFITDDLMGLADTRGVPIEAAVAPPVDVDTWSMPTVRPRRWLARRR